MPSPEYVKWLLLNPSKIDSVKERYPYFVRFIVKYTKERYPQWFSSIENYECYFCGLKFVNLYSLRLHLARTKCSTAFERMLRDILLEWNKFETLCGKLKYRKRKDEKQVLLQMLEDSNTRLEDVYMFCRENS